MTNKKLKERATIIEGLHCPRCPNCDVSVGEPDRFASISLSVSADEESEDATLPKLATSLSINYHDSHDDEPPIGKQRSFPLISANQFGGEGIFCSIPCLREWLNSHLDKMEAIVSEK